MVGKKGKWWESKRLSLPLLGPSRGISSFALLPAGAPNRAERGLPPVFERAL